LQKELGVCKKGVDEINIDVIQEVVSDIGTLIGLANSIKVKKSKIKSYSDGINDDLDEIKSVLNNYQRKLKLATAGMDSAHGD
jgi:hypothetical protein